MRWYLNGLLWAIGLSATEPEKTDWSALHGLNEVRYHRIDRADHFKPLHVFVRLPEDYEATSEQNYPVVYLLDGGITFPLLSGYQRYLELAEDIPATIIVGLSYGTSDWQKGNARSTDYTGPAEGFDHWGGASAFLEFLSVDLVPFVAAHYRTDSNRRILFGQSLAGQFVLYAATQGSDLFTGLIASNPALHRNLPLYLSSKPAAKAVRIFVSSAKNDDPRFREPALAWIKQWTENENPSWELLAESIADQNHFSAAPIAYRRGMKWILNSERPLVAEEKEATTAP